MLYTFDQFALDTDRFEISQNGIAIHAEPQVIELLNYFVRNSGRLVTRDELNQAVWKGRVVSDSAISGRIKIARKLLGDDGRQQKYIRTIHKKGFSFNAQVQADDTAAVNLEDGEQSTGDTHSDVVVSPNRCAPRPSIGVLKFINLSENTERGYFAEGMTEDPVSYTHLTLPTIYSV